MTSVRNRRPALTTNYFADFSGGSVSESLETVRGFVEGGADLVNAASARHAFSKVILGACEIIRRVNPGMVFPEGFTFSGEIGSLGAPLGDSLSMDLIEANEHRAIANGLIYTASVFVERYASEKGVTIPYRSNVTGDYLLDGFGAVFIPGVEEKKSQRSGLMKSELDAALQRWADNLATMASVVNSAPQTPEVVAEETPAPSPEPKASTPAVGE